LASKNRITTIIGTRVSIPAVRGKSGSTDPLFAAIPYGTSIIIITGNIGDGHKLTSIARDTRIFRTEISIITGYGANTYAGTPRTGIRRSAYIPIITFVSVVYVLASFNIITAIVCTGIAIIATKGRPSADISFGTKVIQRTYVPIIAGKAHRPDVHTSLLPLTTIRGTDFPIIAHNRRLTSTDIERAKVPFRTGIPIITIGAIEHIVLTIHKLMAIIHGAVVAVVTAFVCARFTLAVLIAKIIDRTDLTVFTISRFRWEGTPQLRITYIRSAGFIVLTFHQRSTTTQSLGRHA